MVQSAVVAARSASSQVSIGVADEVGACSESSTMKCTLP
jgi:hypothetical protein